MTTIEVRLISGEILRVRCSSEQITIKQFRELLKQQRENLGSCQLFYNGAPLAKTTTIASLNLQPGSFLVALQGSKSKKALPPLPQQPASRANDSSPPRESIVPVALATSPGKLDTLLPGYLSRPQRSPAKAPRKEIDEEQEGGGQDDDAGVAATDVDNNGKSTAQQMVPNRRAPAPSLLELAAAHSLHQELLQEATAAGPSRVAVGLARVEHHCTTANLPIAEAQIPSSSILNNLPPADVVAQIPLPPLLRDLETKFSRLVAMYDFLQRHHIQCTWHALDQSMRSTGIEPIVSLADVKAFAALCPQAVHIAPHVGAGDESHEHKDQWRQTEVEAAAAVPSIELHKNDDDDSYIITLSDPWESRYSDAGAPPVCFLREMRAIAEQYTTDSSQATEVVTNQEEHGDAKTSTTTTKRKRLQSNKKFRMMWELRKALVAGVALIQEHRFDDNVPSFPAVELAAAKPSQPVKRRSMRRSKAGAAKQAEESSKVIDLVAEEEEEESAAAVQAEKRQSCSLGELLHQGRWHPMFLLNEHVTMDKLMEAAAVLDQHRALNVKESDDAPVDALAAARGGAARSSDKPQATKKPRRPAAPPQLLKKHAPCTDTTPLSAVAFLEHLKSLPGYQNQIVHIEHMPARPAVHAALDPPPPPQVSAALQQRGVSQHYSHQVEAITSLRSGNHTVVATSTASGKSLCYIVPILEALVQNPAASAMLMYPTKALAQDQKRGIQEMLTAAFGDAAPAVEIYDGDTSMADRPGIKDRAQILLTNPDMLHVSILPVHSQFSRILSNLALVVVDEAHMYKGVFGCHAALVLRRLRRVCRRVYNTEPTFAVTTATVANPSQHACTLLGVDAVTVVQNDGSPHGKKDFVLWNPPLRNQQQNSGGEEKGSGRAPKKRAKEEAERAALRAARQERNAGVKLGAEVKEDEWTASVAVGQRDSLVKTRLQQPDDDVKEERSTQQGLTERQRKLAAQAAAALSLASDSNSNPATLPPLRPVDATGAAVGHRQVLKIGPQNGTSAVNKMVHSGSRAAQTDDPPRRQHDQVLPSGVRSKAAVVKGGRYGSTGVDESSVRSSPIVEMAALLAESVQHGLRTIAFCKTRKLSELVIAYVREILAVTAPDLSNKVAVYRAGYSPAERREIEAALFSGSLLAVAATNALELGVDIGGLDCTLHLGFPGSIASLWQQSGRAGRREQPSISIYVGWDGPLDQYFLTQPSNLFSRPIEAAMVDVHNPQALQAHVACAAYEAQIDPAADAQEFFGPGIASALSELQHKGVLGRNYLYTGSATHPASAMTLRAIDPERYSIIDESHPNGGKVLEEVEESKAFYQVYEGSTYFFQGRTYLCKQLDLDARVAIVRPADVKYYTKPVDYTAVTLIGGGENAFPPAAIAPSSSSSPMFPTSAIVSAATVTTRWLGYVRVWRGTGQVFDSVDLFLPDVQYETEAASLRLPPAARFAVEAAGLPFRDGVHAAAHAVLNVLPLFLMANPQDVGTECDNPYDTRYKPERILIYDKHPGGIGLAAAARPRFTELLVKALAVLSSCPCSMGGGCPACVQHTDCGEYNAVINKEAGRLVLKAALEAEAEKYGLDKAALGLK